MAFPGPGLSVWFTLKWNYLLQVVLELCRAEPIADAETIEMHLERIRALVSTWAAQVSLSLCTQRSAICSCFPWTCHFNSHMLNPCGPFSQPCFAEVEFPESNFVDQVELLLKDPEEKERFFQVVFTAVFFLFNSCMMEIHGNKALLYTVVCFRTFFPRISGLNMTARYRC